MHKTTQVLRVLLPGLRRGTRGFFLPAGVFDATKCGPADDLRGLLGVGYEMAAAKQGLPCELYMRYKAHADAHPEDEVRPPTTHG